MLAILKGETAETGIPLDRERKNTKQTQSRTTHRQSMGYDGFEYGAPAQRVGLTVKGGVNLDHFGGAKVDQLVKG